MIHDVPMERFGPRETQHGAYHRTFWVVLPTTNHILCSLRAYIFRYVARIAIAMCNPRFLWLPHLRMAQTHTGPCFPILGRNGLGSWGHGCVGGSQKIKHSSFPFRCGSNKGKMIENGTILADFGCRRCLSGKRRAFAGQIGAKWHTPTH